MEILCPTELRKSQGTSTTAEIHITGGAAVHPRSPVLSPQSVQAKLIYFWHIRLVPNSFPSAHMRPWEDILGSTDLLIIDTYKW